jgi:hypothetical protein
VHAVLGAQVAVGIVAGDLQRRALDAGDLAVAPLQLLDLEAPLVAEPGVHALEHRRPVLRFGAARAGLDVHEAVIRVEGVGEHAAEFEAGNALFEFFHVGKNRDQRRVVALGARHLEQLFRVLQARADLGQHGDGAFEGFLFPAELLGSLLVVPDAGIGEQLFYFREALLLAFEVKDTSAALPTACSGQ